MIIHKLCFNYRKGRNNAARGTENSTSEIGGFIKAYSPRKTWGPWCIREEIGENTTQWLRKERGLVENRKIYTWKMIYFLVLPRTNPYILFSLGSFGPKYSKLKDFLEKYQNYLFLSYEFLLKCKICLGSTHFPWLISWKLCHEIENHKVNCFYPYEGYYNSELNSDSKA